MNEGKRERGREEEEELRKGVRRPIADAYDSLRRPTEKMMEKQGKLQLRAFRMGLMHPRSISRAYI